MSTASAAVSAGMRAGAIDTSRMCRTCSFSIGPNGAGRARADDGNLALQIDERLEDRLVPAERVPCRPEIVGLVDRHLPLAVVAERRRLENRGAADFLDRGREIRLARDARERRDRQAVLGEKRLLAQPVLRDRQRAAVGPDDRVRFGRGGGGRGHVLEFEGHDVDSLREGRDRLDIVVRRVDFDVGDLAGGRVVLGRECVDAIAKTARGHREHAAELTASENADDGAWRDHCGWRIADRGLIVECGLRIDRSAIRHPPSAMSEAPASHLITLALTVGLQLRAQVGT
jgi:hypothetical protein